MHGAPHHGAEFAHFDYVNPGAPVGGTLRQTTNDATTTSRRRLACMSTIAGTTTSSSSHHQGCTKLT